MNVKNLGSVLLLLSLLIISSAIPFGQNLKFFPIGEKLEYEARFGFIDLGNMVLKIVDTTTVDGKQCYLITSYLNSSSDLKFLFSLNDTINVTTTINDLMPVFYEKRIHEGKYTNYQKLKFNQDSLYVIINDSSKIKISQRVMDLLSFWYYLRCVPLIENDTIVLYIFEAKQQHRIDCVVGKKEIIRTPLGKFSTIRVTPKTSNKGVFGAGGSMDIWYTNDEKRFPVQIKTKLKFGTVLFKLKEVSN
ncbi:MAG: DUF3108 domain-containing protein [candidate division WOR-3 bacterium]